PPDARASSAGNTTIGSCREEGTDTFSSYVFLCALCVFALNVSVRFLTTEAFEAVDGGLEGLQLLAEGGAGLAPALLGVGVEAAAGHDRDADLFHEVMGEGHVVVEAEGVEVAHDVVGAGRCFAAESQAAQMLDEEVAALAVLGEELDVIVVGQ